MKKFSTGVILEGITFNQAKQKSYNIKNIF